MIYNTQVVLAYWKSEGLPVAIPEYKFHKTRRWRCDFCFPDEKVIVEIEGGCWTKGRHTRGKGFMDDLEKYSEAQRMGYRIIRTVPTNLCMMDTVNLIKDIIKWRVVHVDDKTRRL